MASADRHLVLLDYQAVSLQAQRTMRPGDPYTDMPPGVPNPYRHLPGSGGATYTRPDFRRQQQQPPPGMPSSSSAAQQQQSPYGYAPSNAWGNLQYDRAPTSLPPTRPPWPGHDPARPPSAGLLSF